MSQYHQLRQLGLICKAPDCCAFFIAGRAIHDTAQAGQGWLCHSLSGKGILSEGTSLAA